MDNMSRYLMIKSWCGANQLVFDPAPMSPGHTVHDGRSHRKNILSRHRDAFGKSTLVQR